MPKRENRLPVLLADEELKEITEYRWRYRVPSLTEAARRLIAKGLKTEKAETARTVSAE